MSLAEVAKAIVVKHGKQMAIELIEQVAIEALEDAVKATPMPLDDVAVAALKEPLKKALVDAINKIAA